MRTLYLYKEDFADENMWYELLYRFDLDNNATEIKLDISNVTVKVFEKINELVSDSEKGLLIKNGINVSIVGKPNVGKSSILNTLLNDEKS